MLARKLSLTFVLYIALAVVASEQHVNRDVGHRLIRKRALLNTLGTVDEPKGEEEEANSALSSTGVSTTLSATTSSSASSSVQTSASSSTSSVSSASASSSASSSSSSSSVAQATSSAPPKPTADETPEPVQEESTPAEAENLSKPSSTKVIVVEKTLEAQVEDEGKAVSDSAAKGDDSNTSSTAVKIIGIIAGCVGAAAIIWTVIRKWKFKPSKEFEDRMQPIDWQPNADDAASLHRANSGSSFVSGTTHRNNATYGATSNHGHGLTNGVPDHDFTAGAPVGGYADLARGHTPGPQMQEVYGRQDVFEHNPRY